MALAIVSCNFNRLKNTESHRTVRFNKSLGDKDLVVRRGQEFTITLEFNKPINLSQNRINIIVALEDSNGVRQLQFVLFVKDTPFDTSKKPVWWASTSKQVWTKPSNQIPVEILTSVAAPVGIWRITRVNIWNKNKYDPVKSPAFEKFYVLFNAWNKDDEVYLPDPQERDFYVLEDSGQIIQGIEDDDDVLAKEWVFGQYTPKPEKADAKWKSVLEIIMIMLDVVVKVPPRSRNAINISRAMTLAREYLHGFWGTMDEEDERDGAKDPTYWDDSSELLQKWEAQRVPVAYAQCWVFGGVLTTIMRTIGIPCRVLTCFDSVHDHDFSQTMDSYLKDNGGAVPDIDQSREKTWNYHVWNEAWMKRPDLPGDGKYDGWQIIDGTPQETSRGSGGVNYCGPASQLAVYLADVDLEYDTGFVLTECNGDEITWSYEGSNVRERGRVVNNFTGSALVTQSIEKNAEWYTRLTYLYKPREGTQRERDQNSRAHKIHRGMVFPRTLDLTNRSADVWGRDKDEKPYVPPPRQPFSFLLGTPSPGNKQNYDKETLEIKLEVPKNTTVGSSFDIIVKCKNLASAATSVKAVLDVQTTDYTSAVLKQIRSETKDLNIPGHRENSFTSTFKPSDYSRHLSSDLMFIAKIRVVQYLEGTPTGLRRFSVLTLPFKLAPPNINIETSSNWALAYAACDVRLSLRNPLDVPLTNGVFRVNGPLLSEFQEIQIRPVAAGALAEAGFKVQYKTDVSGRTAILGGFRSKQLKGINGSKDLLITTDPKVKSIWDINKSTARR